MYSRVPHISPLLITALNWLVITLLNNQIVINIIQLSLQESGGTLGLTVEEMREVMGDILQRMKCPGCLKLPALNPVGLPRQCRKGHVVCFPCSNNLLSCPSCNSPFILKPPSVYVKVLNALPAPKDWFLLAILHFYKRQRFYIMVLIFQWTNFNIYFFC